MGKLSVVVGGQYGSEAKGHVVGYLSKAINNNGPVRERQVSVVRVGGPNAGHTVYGSCPTDCPSPHMAANDHPWRLRSLPVAVISNPLARLYIAAGSEVDPSVLLDEIAQVNRAGFYTNGRLVVDINATWLEERFIRFEEQSSLVERLGSTAKGIGAARSERIWRNAKRWADYVSSVGHGKEIISHVDTAEAMYDDLETGGHVIVEGTQGYGLGLHTEAYPQVTSGDCRAIDFLAQAGISPWSPEVSELDVWVTVRTRPIRVAGNSGPLAGETTWEAIGLPEERTTVTNKVRRVGEMDYNLLRKAVNANGAGPNVRIALMMADYELPEIKGMTHIDQMGDGETYSRFLNLIYEIEFQAGCKVGLVGTGPNSMLDLRGPR